MINFHFGFDKEIKQELLIFSFLLLVALIVFYPSFAGGPIFDDLPFFFNSPEFTFNKDPFIFWNPDSILHKSWPLSHTILFILHKTFGTKYVLYKLLNIMMHTINSYLLYRISHRFVSKKISTATALFFLVHPAQVITVCWIFQFKTLLSTLFILMSTSRFLDWVEELRYRDGILSLLLFSCSLLSKSAYILTPFLFITYFIFRNRVHKKHIPHFLLLMLFCLSSLFSGTTALRGVEIRNKLDPQKIETATELKKEPSPAPVSVPEQTKIEEQVKAERQEQFSEHQKIKKRFRDDLLFSTEDPFYPAILVLKRISYYFSKFFYPTDFSFSYPKRVSFNLFDLLSVGSFLSFIILISFMSYFRFIKTPLTFIISVGLIYMVNIIPVSGIINLSYFNQVDYVDNWGYPAYFSCALFFSYLIFNVFNRRVGTIFCMAIAASLSLTSWSFGKIFNDEQLLYEDLTSKKSSNYYFYRLLLGKYQKTQQYRAAFNLIQNMKNDTRFRFYPPAQEDFFIWDTIAHISGLRPKLKPNELKRTDTIKVRYEALLKSYMISGDFERFDKSYNRAVALNLLTIRMKQFNYFNEIEKILNEDKTDN